ncbi:MAG TPA: TRAM domain-containing protein, partial [Acidimicrobiales bacterium]|nr:TRAM domain-containing protein [Acidimicrobiales bacterium]
MATGGDDELLELQVGAIAGGGGCVGRAPDGKVVFVRHSLPGERVRARITAETSSYLRADAVEVLSASPDRVDPPCPHAGPGRCGGCDFQHVGLDAQRRLKAARIAELLSQIAGIEREVAVEAVEGDDDGLGWRTRVRLAVDRDGHTGFRRHRSHRVERVDACPVTSSEVGATGALRAVWPGTAELEVVTGTV